MFQIIFPSSHLKRWYAQPWLRWLSATTQACWQVMAYNHCNRTVGAAVCHTVTQIIRCPWSVISWTSQSSPSRPLSRFMSRMVGHVFIRACPARAHPPMGGSLGELSARSTRSSGSLRAARVIEPDNMHFSLPILWFISNVKRRCPWRDVFSSPWGWLGQPSFIYDSLSFIHPWSSQKSSQYYPWP